MNCVTSHGATYDATFGYQNDNESAVTVSAGPANGFTPAPTDRGQVTRFLPGNVQQAFTVKGVPRAAQLTWIVTYVGAARSATASSAFARACGEAPEPAGPIGLFACTTPRGSTYDITFGYVNENPVAVSIPVGIANAVLPSPVDRGQPELFAPGRVEAAFTVKGVPGAGTVVWRVAHLGTKLLVVSASHTVRCGSPSALPVQVFPLCSLRTGSTYIAAFGYLNSGSATIRVRRGSQNAISPASYGGAQPEVFLPGLTAVDTTVACHEPLGAVTSTTSPTVAPSKAEPSGESGNTPPTAEISTSISSPPSSAISTIDSDADVSRRSRAPP